jgi:hypothetical protein
VRSTPTGAVGVPRRRGQFGAEGEAPVTRAGSTCDDRRRKELEEVFTGDDELRAAVNGACMISLAAARVVARRGCGGSICGEGSRRDPWGGFIEREEGERGRWPGHWPSMPWRAPAVSKRSRGGGLNGGGTEGIDGGNEVGALAHFDGEL